MKTIIYRDTITGNLVDLLGTCTTPESDQNLIAKRNTDLRHALNQIVNAKRRGLNQAVFRHHAATMAAVHESLRRLGFLARKDTPETSVVTWAPPQ